MSSDATGPSAGHPIPIGATVTILRTSLDRSPFIEGQATILGRSQANHSYSVQFIDDPVARERTVHPTDQPDPAAMLRPLRELWHAEHATAAAWADFFPEADH